MHSGSGNLMPCFVLSFVFSGLTVLIQADTLIDTFNLKNAVAG